jgi:hypothetical protein
MHIHVLPGARGTVSVHHGDHCVVAVVRLGARVVRLAHGLQHAQDHVQLVGGGLAADVECWDSLTDEERRVPCICQAPGDPPCAQAVRSGSGVPVAA